jgi:hypothetical protein
LKESSPEITAKVCADGFWSPAGNSRSLRQYLYASRRLLFKWLNRRSQRRGTKWDRLDKVLRRPRIIHNLYPDLLRKPHTGSRMV